MKRTQVTELFANIKNTFVSFFSIFMFVALGVGVFLGISWAGPALQNAADGMLGEGQFHNFQIQYPYGLTDDDIEELTAVEGVSQVEPERQSFQTLHRGNTNYTVKVQSLGEQLDVPIVREGVLPAKPGEMAFHAESAAKLGVSVGDTVTFEHDAADDDALTLETASDAASGESAAADVAAEAAKASGMKYLTSDTFKVTAIIDSVDYLAKSAETYGYSSSPAGTVEALAWVTDDAFSPSAFRDGYPVVNVRSESLDGIGTFSDAYAQGSSEIEDRISALGVGLAQARYDKLHGDAKSQLDAAQKKLDDGKARIADGEQQITDGEAKLEQGRAELDKALADGEAALASGYNTLMEGEAVKAQAEASLADARAQLDEARTGLDAVDAAKAEAQAAADEMRAYKAEQDAALSSGKITQKEYNDNLDRHGAQMNARVAPIAEQTGTSVPSINHANYGQAIAALDSAVSNVDNTTVTVNGETMTIAEARDRVAEYEQETENAQATLDAKTAELNDGWAQYYAGQQELENRKAQGEQELADGEAELENAKTRLADAKAEVAENEPKLDAAKEKVAALKKFDWSVLPRSFNAGVVEVVTFSDVTANLSISMAALFIIVGLLVSYFAVSRIVHEQVTQIGTKKALGFRKGEITTSFLLYSGIAVLAGVIVGALVAYVIVEGIIGGVLAGMFAFGTYPAHFGWPLFLVMGLLELVLILAATYLACRRVLKEHAIELLRGEKPPAGKTRFYEKWGIWEKVPLFIQTIVNNCVNDRRRVLSTIVGVAGSTALIVTAITLNNDVMKSYDRQYQDVYGFNAIAYVDSGVEGAIGEVESALEGEGATATRVFMKRYLMEQPDGKSGAMRVIVPLEEDAFAQAYSVNPVGGGTPDLTGEGAWVSQAYAEHMGAKVGDVIVIDSGSGTKHEVPILGFSEFWLTYHEMVMSADYYKKEFGDTSTGASADESAGESTGASAGASAGESAGESTGASANALLVQTGGKPVADFSEAASKVAGFDSLVDDASYQYENFETFSSVSGAVVAIYLALSVLMAIVVLLNLNVMFIEEKKRELIVLMINGYSVKDAKHYISYDSIVLTVLGIIVGVILGCIMGSVTVAAIEPSTGVFVKSPDLWAILIGIVGSAVLAVIMNVIALRRISRFNLTDINKQ